MEKKTDLRIIKTQKSLCNAFLELLSEKRFEEITVNELCEKALVRRATFYKHFADKYDFYSFFVREMESQLCLNPEIFQDSPNSNSYYIFLFQEFIHFLVQHEKLLQNVLNSSAFLTLLDILSDEIYNNIYLFLSEQKKAGTTFPMSLPALAHFYSGGILHMLNYWLKNRDTISEEEIVKDFERTLTLFSINRQFS